MPIRSEDDFGKVGLTRCIRGAGICQPVHYIGSTLRDLPEEAITGRCIPALAESLGGSRLELGSVHCPEALSARRHRAPVVDPSTGLEKQKNKLSDGVERPTGIRITDFDVRPCPEPGAKGKRCYDWTHGPTGYQNPLQWEEPPVPGQRPSHPVSARGVVCLKQKRDYPEKREEETACPGEPRLSQAPFGNEWGGWGRSGAPGRAPLVQPWDSLTPRRPGAESDRDAPVEADYRLSDAKRRPFPDKMYPPTAHLTRWHLDLKDAEPCKRKQVHQNMPHQERPTGPGGVPAMPPLPPAGKPSFATPR